MQSLKHPNVIQFQKYIGTDKFHAIVMEYANGKDLLTYVSKFDKIIIIVWLYFLNF